jgi:hypothetical protein
VVNRTTYIQPYLHWINHLIERIGQQNALDVWETTFKNYDHSAIQSILSSGWKKIINSDPRKDDEIEKQFSAYVSRFSDFIFRNHVKKAIETTPPIGDVIELFGYGTYEKEISAYDALLLRFDSQACLAETMIEKFGKQGELIVYDIMIKIRLAMTNDETGTVEEFIEDFTSLPAGKNLFSAGLEIDVVHKSQSEAIVHVTECEWARYFRNHHPDVGYLLACSTDEAAYQAFNSNLKLQRTGTLMEGSDKCDFRVYTL